MPIVKRHNPRVIRVKARNYDYSGQGDYVYFTVDVIDAWVLNYVWYTIRGGYVATTVKNKTMLVHRMIMPEAKEVDHRDRNKLHNRRSNLRVSDRSRNTHNTPPRNATGYKGVYPASKNRFIAKINENGIQKTIGYFHEAVDAARAYDKEAKRIYGSHAYQNFVR